MTALGNVICVRKNLKTGIQNINFIKLIKKHSLPVTTVMFSRKGGKKICVRLSQNVKFECLQAVNSGDGID